MTRSTPAGPVLAYLILRLTLGINMLMHGATRVFGDYRGFAEGLIERFGDTLLPGFLLVPFAYALPIAELLIGLLLVLGLFTRWALAAGGLLIAVLVFGSCLVQDWSAAGTQMLYALIFYVLLHQVDTDRYGLDARRPPSSTT